MQYETIDDLPAPVRHHLPHHAQEIYRAAFNNAWNEYADPADRLDGNSRGIRSPGCLGCGGAGVHQDQ